MSFTFWFQISPDKCVDVTVMGIHNTDYCRVIIKENTGFLSTKNKEDTFKKVHLRNVKDFLQVLLYNTNEFKMTYSLNNVKKDIIKGYVKRSLEQSIDKFCSDNNIIIDSETHKYKVLTNFEEHEYRLQRYDEDLDHYQDLYLDDCRELINVIFKFLYPIVVKRDNFDVLDMSKSLKKSL